MSSAAPQLNFGVNGDNRAGRVSAQVGTRTDARENSYNIDPGENKYAKVSRSLTTADGSGAGRIAVMLETSSEFVDYAKGQCAGLVFASKGTIGLPEDASVLATGIVADHIQMGIRIQKTGKVRLTASVVSDLDIVVISFSGPSFDSPIRIFDDYDETLDITKPGEYSLKGAYQLALRLPNATLGGRALAVQMHATLRWV